MASFFSERAGRVARRREVVAAALFAGVFVLGLVLGTAFFPAAFLAVLFGAEVFLAGVFFAVLFLVATPAEAGVLLAGFLVAADLLTLLLEEAFLEVFFEEDLADVFFALAPSERLVCRVPLRADFAGLFSALLALCLFFPGLMGAGT